jgi:hypothetical protein
MGYSRRFQGVQRPLRASAFRPLLCLINPCKTSPAALRHRVAGGGKVLVPGVKSFVGTVLIILLVITYALLATTFATLLLGSSPWWVHFLYFLLTGLLWILPAMLIIKWMAGSRPRR